MKLNKKSSIPLPVQIKDLIVERIREARYAPGERIDSVRTLMDELSCCRLTVLEAFHLLEKENYVIRVPSSGVYVNENHADTSRTVRIASVFPGKSFDVLRERHRRWHALQELNMGYLIGCSRYNATVTYEYFEDDPSELELRRQVKKLETYDAVIMPSSSQLSDLKERMAMIRPCFISMETMSEAQRRQRRKTFLDPYWFQDSMAALLEHVSASGFKSCGLFFPESETLARKHEAEFEYLQARFAEFELDLRKEHYLSFPWRERPCVEGVTDYFRAGDLPDFIFWNISESIRPLYGAAFAAGTRLGHDVGAAGRGVALEQMAPTFTHVKLPCEEVGIGAIRNIVKTICPDRDLGPEIHPLPRLMIGGTTKLNLIDFEELKIHSHDDWLLDE